MTAKRTAQIFKALARFVGPHYNLAFAYAPNAHVIQATDGVKAIRISFTGDGHGLSTGFYDCKKTLARIKADLAPETSPESHTFPDLDRVLPELGDKGTPGVSASFNPEYMGEVMEALCLITGGENVRIQPSSNCLGIWRFDGKSDDCTVWAVLMPIRA